MPRLAAVGERLGAALLLEDGRRPKVLVVDPLLGDAEITQRCVVGVHEARRAAHVDVRVQVLRQVLFEHRGVDVSGAIVVLAELIRGGGLAKGDV